MGNDSWHFYFSLNQVRASYTQCNGFDISGGVGGSPSLKYGGFLRISPGCGEFEATGKKYFTTFKL